MSQSAAVKRLKRILDSEEYGPRLARISKASRADEAYILDLIDRNLGDEARREILRLDKERIERRRSRGTSVVDIETLRRRAYTNMRQQLQGKPNTIVRGVAHMTDDELTFAAREKREALRRKAGDRSLVRAYEDLDIEINPFWYK